MWVLSSNYSFEIFLLIKKIDVRDAARQYLIKNLEQDGIKFHLDDSTS